MIPRPPGLDWMSGLPDPFGALGPLVAPLDGMREVNQVRRGLWVHATTPRPPVGTTPHKVVFRQNKLELRYYAPPAPSGLPPVVLVPSLINRAYILDLEPDRSLVASLARLGHPVYLLDWGVPGEEDGPQDVATVVLTLLHRALDRACRHAGHPAAHLLGYCQGGTLAAMYAALRPARVASLFALTAPFFFAEGGRFRAFVDPGHFDVTAAIPADGLVPISLMQVAFKLLDPMGNWSKFIALDASAQDAVSLGRALARERWLEENVPMPGAFAREFIRMAYQEDRLVKGGWSLRGEAIDLKKIRVPVCNALSLKDSICPPAAARPLNDLVSSEINERVELSTGHIGVVVGSFGPKVFYPMLDRWFRTQKTGMALPPGAPEGAPE